MVDARTHTPSGFDTRRLVISRNDHLLIAMAVANVATAVYILVVCLQVETLGVWALAILCLGVFGATFVSRQMIVDAFTSRWKARLWIAAALYCPLMVVAVGVAVLDDTLTFIPTWPVGRACGMWFQFAYGAPRSEPDIVDEFFGGLFGLVLYCFVLFAIGALHCAFWNIRQQVSGAATTTQRPETLNSM